MSVGREDVEQARTVLAGRIHRTPSVTSSALGVSLMPWQHGGFFAQVHRSFAPTVKNRIGDVHDDGGLFLLVGMRGAR